MWNYKRKGAWEAYKEATSQVTMEFPDESNIDVDDIQEKLERKIKNVKFKVFGKTTKRKSGTNSEVASLMRERAGTQDKRRKDDLDDLITDRLVSEKYDAVNKDIARIKKNNSNQQLQTYALRKLISGNDDFEPPTAIVDPYSNEMLVNKKEILEATLKFPSQI